MNFTFEKFLDQLIATSGWEWLAVILAVCYLGLAIKENSLCWPAAFFSTAIYSFLFFDVNLYMESLLNIYYLAMAVYGWYQWRGAKQSLAEKKITSWSKKTHVTVIAISIILVIIVGNVLIKYTDQDFAFLDSFTTLFAIITTYMVTQKILENWIYWIVIDSVSIYIYLSKGLALTAVLFLLYVILAFVGWKAWKKHYDTDERPAA